MSTKARRGRGARSSQARPEAATVAAPPRPEVARPGPSTTSRRNRLWLVGALALVALVLVGLVIFGLGLGIIGTNPIPASYSPDGRISFVRQSPDGSKRD